MSPEFQEILPTKCGSCELACCKFPKFYCLILVILFVLYVLLFLYPESLFVLFIICFIDMVCCMHHQCFNTVVWATKISHCDQICSSHLHILSLGRVGETQSNKVKRRLGLIKGKLTVVNCIVLYMYVVYCNYNVAVSIVLCC